MLKYLISTFTVILFMTVKSYAAPLHAYYCFNLETEESINTFIGAFDNFFASPASQGVSTHRLYAFPLNGANKFSHCIVTENSSPSQFEKNNKIVNSSVEGQELLGIISGAGEIIMEGAGTPIIASDNQNPTSPVGVIIDIRAKNSKAFVDALSKLVNSPGQKGEMIVFEDTFTGIKGRTHYVVINGSSLEEALSNLDETLASDDGQEYLRGANKFRRVMDTALLNLVKSWEAE